MRSEISFDHHSFQNDPGMTVFCHSDLILSFETKDERNEVDKVPYRDIKEVDTEKRRIKMEASLTMSWDDPRAKCSNQACLEERFVTQSLI